MSRSRSTKTPTRASSRPVRRATEAPLSASQYLCVTAAQQACAEGRAMLVIEGRSGTGRSRVAQAILRAARTRGPSQHVLDGAHLSADDLIAPIAELLGVSTTGDTAAVLDAVVRRLSKPRRSRSQRRLVIDDADRLTPEARIALTRLAALAAPGEAPLLLVLLGRRGLRASLAAASPQSPHGWATAHLSGLSLEETRRMLGQAWRIADDPYTSASSATLLTLHLLARGRPARVQALAAAVRDRVGPLAMPTVSDVLAASARMAGVLPLQRLTQILRALLPLGPSASGGRAPGWVAVAAAVALGFVLGQAGPSAMVEEVRAAPQTTTVSAPAPLLQHAPLVSIAPSVEPVTPETPAVKAMPSAPRVKESVPLAAPLIHSPRPLSQTALAAPAKLDPVPALQPTVTAPVVTAVTTPASAPTMPSVPVVTPMPASAAVPAAAPTVAALPASAASSTAEASAEPRGTPRIEKKPRTVADSLTRAGEALALGRTSEAVALLRKVLAAEPGHLDAWASLVSTLADRARDEEWLDALGQAASVSPERFGLSAAQAYAETGRHEQASTVLATIPVEVRDAAYFSLSGLVSMRLNRTEAALTAFESALARTPLDDPRRASLTVARAVALEQLGRITEARSLYEVVAADEGARQSRVFARDRLATLDSAR